VYFWDKEKLMLIQFSSLKTRVFSIFPKLLSFILLEFGNHTRDVLVQFWTMVRTWTFQNLTKVRFKIWAERRTELIVRSNVQRQEEVVELVRTYSDLFEPMETVSWQSLHLIYWPLHVTLPQPLLEHYFEADFQTASTHSILHGFAWNFKYKRPYMLSSCL
jgi:hypothetical protein